MQGFMRTVAAGCVAFTFSSLLYLVCSVLGFFPSYTDKMVFNMLFLSFAIMLLIYLTHLLPIESSFFARLFELFSVFTVLMLAGFLFKMFPFTIEYIIPTLVIGMFTYFIVILVIFIGDQASANRINAVLRQNNEVQL